MTGKSLRVDPQKEIEDLRSLLNATHMLSSGLHLEEVLKQTLNHAMAVTSAEAATIWLIEENKKKLTPFAAIGGRSQELQDISIRVGDGIAGIVAKDKKPVVVQDVSVDGRFNSRVDEATGFRTRNTICVCLQCGEEILGSLQVLNKTGRRKFNRRDIEMLSAFSSLAVGMIRNGKLHNDLQTLYTSTMRSLVATIDARDPYTAGHSDRVSKLVVNVCKNLGFSEDEFELYERSALLHDIGKIGVNDSILRKKGRLSDQEFMEIKRHPIIGKNIVKEIEPKQFSKELVKGINYHHERIDAAGYPEGLSGQKIPLVAKIISVADTYDALTSDRSYRNCFPRDKAIAVMRDCAGTQLDKKIVEKMLETV